ncbi:MAG: DNA repair protein RecO [Planctomycetota bacterium]|jgi:DNA repair protein RecO (recombination protein O)
MLTKDTAICIRAVDFSETSQIVTFFTKANGKISAIAKGAKRPKSVFDGPVEVFAHGEIVFSDSAGEKLAVLTEFQQQPTLTSLSANLFTLYCASFAAELVNNLTDEHDPHSQLFYAFLQFLKSIQETSHESRDIISLLILFQLALLKEVGLQPVLSCCVNCKNNFHAGWPKSYFSHSANGLICKDCEASFPDRFSLTGAAANALSNFKLLADADEKTLNEIEKLLINHFTEILHKPPKMAKYFSK